MLKEDLYLLRVNLANAASTLAGIAKGRNLDDPEFRAEIAPYIANAPQLAELALNFLRGSPPTDEELLDYCLSEEVMNRGK